MNKLAYKTNPITSAIFKINFPKILEINEKNPPYKFQNEIKKEYPEVIIKPSYNLNPEGIIGLRAEGNENWIFKNKNKNRSIGVSPEHIVMEFLQYDNFDEFKGEIKDKFSKFIQIYNPEWINRIGLRYINIVKRDEGDLFDWKGLINENLIQVEEFIESKNNIIRSVHEIELKHEDYRFRFRFGIFNNDYPADLIKKEFILDYDCFILDELKITEIYKKLDEFHDITHDWFEKSITDKLRRSMDEQTKNTSD